MRTTYKRLAYGICSFCVLVFAYTALAVTIDNPLNANDFKTLLLNIAKAVGELVTALGTLMVLVSGIMFAISGGSQERMNTAKAALMYAIAGIAIGLLSTAIVNFVLDTLGTS